MTGEAGRMMTKMTSGFNCNNNNNNNNKITYMALG